jgi:hypothetical protein
MGGFYGSIHIQGANQQTIKDALEPIAKKHKARFLIGPPRNNWVSVYPHTNGQDDRLAEKIARAVRGECVHVVVHDDDLFAYDYFRDGERIDSYNSRPDYFRKVSTRERDRLRGRPELLRHLLLPGKSLEELTNLLSDDDEEKSVFASDELERFADLLGLPNVITAYEYLMDGETDGTDGWDEFIHVPDISAEKAQKQAAQAKVDEEKEGLRQAGLLVYERCAPEFATIAWAADRTGSGFLVAWQHFRQGQPQTRPLERIGPPWAEQAQSTGITLGPSVFQLCRSPTGRLLAASHASGNWKCALWDLERQALLWEIDNEPHTAPRLLFSPDEKYIVRCDQHHVDVLKAETGRRLAHQEVEGGTCAALHPSGTLVLGHPRGKLIFLDPMSGRRSKTLCLGGQVNERGLHLFSAALIQSTMEHFDAEQPRKEMEKMLKSLGKTFAAESSPEQREQLEQAGYRFTPDGELDIAKSVEAQLAKIQEGLEAQRQRFAQTQASTGVESDAIRGSEQPWALLCPPDGQFLCVGTEKGVRVHDWSALLDAREVTPAPVNSVETSPCAVYPDRYSFQVRALAFDEPANRLLFAGVDGIIRCLGIPSGEPKSLLTLPARTAILDMGLSADRRFLCCQMHVRPMDDMRSNPPPILQVWDYTLLTDRLEGRGP